MENQAEVTEEIEKAAAAAAIAVAMITVVGKVKIAEEEGDKISTCIVLNNRYRLLKD